MSRPGPAWLVAGGLIGLAALGPLLVGSPRPPSLSPTSAQLLPPGTAVQELRGPSGELVRAPRIFTRGDRLWVEDAAGERALPLRTGAASARYRRLWLGSDHQGRDLLARVVHGARVSLAVAALALSVALLLGTAVGLAAAMAPPPIGVALEIATDALLGLPRLLLLLMLGVTLGGSAGGVGLAIGCSAWMELARLVQGETRALRARGFVVAARGSGAGPWRIGTLHLLPNLAFVIGAVAPLVATEAVLLESTLSFLGVAGGSDNSWGRIIADGRRLLPHGWWLVLFPGLLLFVAAWSVHALARPQRGVPTTQRG